MPKGLTLLQERFVEEFAKDRCLGKAYVRAGGKAKDPKVAGFHMSRVPKVAERLRELHAETKKALADKFEITAADVAKGLLDIFRTCSKRMPIAGKTGEPVMDENGELLYRLVDAKNAVAALNRLGDYTGGFSLKQELSGPGGKDFQIVLFGDSRDENSNPAQK